MPDIVPPAPSESATPTPTHVHEWRIGSDPFTSWRDCLACGKREWFMEVELP